MAPLITRFESCRLLSSGYLKDGRYADNPQTVEEWKQVSEMP